MGRQVSTRPHRRLAVWAEGIELVKMVYRATEVLPREEMYGLTAQMRRSAISVCSNIAEGAARGSPQDFARFLNIARGSLSELDTQVHIAMELGYLENDEALQAKQDEVSRLLNGLHRKITQSPSR
ncbi:MAG: four helix bundle protein [Spiribacter salinus]|uniref:Four helix bundle protein n=1 Tax=Spiribacter salinus TaxID=1335746 RepID=A0A540VQW1_9GAMM|nr:MAG: four helix bundle protein [Spiribacter salinus]